MCELACVNSYHRRLDTTRLVSRVVGEPIAESGVVGEPIVESRVVGEPIVESRVVGEPLKQVGKYLYTVETGV
jgi:hypothetical protein